MSDLFLSANLRQKIMKELDLRGGISLVQIRRDRIKELSNLIKKRIDSGMTIDPLMVQEYNKLTYLSKTNRLHI